MEVSEVPQHRKGHIPIDRFLWLGHSSWTKVFVQTNNCFPSYGQEIIIMLFFNFFYTRNGEPFTAAGKLQIQPIPASSGETGKRNYTTLIELNLGPTKFQRGWLPSHLARRVLQHQKLTNCFSKFSFFLSLCALFLCAPKQASRN